MINAIRQDIEAVEHRHWSFQIVSTGEVLLRPRLEMLDTDEVSLRDVSVCWVKQEYGSALSQTLLDAKRQLVICQATEARTAGGKGCV